MFIVLNHVACGIPFSLNTCPSLRKKFEKNKNPSKFEKKKQLQTSIAQRMHQAMLEVLFHFLSINYNNLHL